MISKPTYKELILVQVQDQYDKTESFFYRIKDKTAWVMRGSKLVSYTPRVQIEIMEFV